MQVHGALNLVYLVWAGLAIYCIIDLYQPSRRVLGFTKNIWALIILFIGIIGAVSYLLYGRDTSSR
jgi:hypothetical protein